MLHLRCVTQLTLVCILRYSGCSSLPIQSSVCYDIQNGSLCRSSFLYATLFQNASLCLSGVLYATLFKILSFTNLIPIRFKKLPTTRTGRHSARLRPSAGFFSSFRSECTAEAQDTGWLCFCRRGALLRWRESALFFKSPLSERRHAASSDFWKTVLAESRRPRTSPRRSRRPDSIPFHGVRSVHPHKKGDTPISVSPLRNRILISYIYLRKQLLPIRFLPIKQQ